jgi:flagellar hook-associated protein 3 FlgL
MRVTDNSFLHSYMTNLNSGRERILNLQAQLATGKRVNKSSDDPQATDTILRMERTIERNEQFQRNISNGRAMMDVTGSVLNAIADYLIEVQEILVATNNPTRKDELNIFATRMDELIGEVLDQANHRFNGKYIFGGTQTLAKPYEIDAGGTEVTANPNGIDGTIEYPISEGIKQKMNISGNDAFQGTALFAKLIEIRDTLAAGEHPPQNQLDDILDLRNTVLGQASRVGSITKSLENVETQLIEQNVHLNTLLSLDQDTDIAEALMQLSHEELMLNAALKTGARILPMSLLDFLR